MTGSRPSTASGIATRTRKPRRPDDAFRRRRAGGIAGLILLANLAGLAVLVAGALVLNELRAGLVTAKIESLRSQGETLVSVLAEAATEGEPAPRLAEDRARAILQRLYVAPDSRVRLFLPDGSVAADSQLLLDQVEVRPLPPIGAPDPEASGPFEALWRDMRSGLALLRGSRPMSGLVDDIAAARRGEIVASQRIDEEGDRVVAVTLPIQRVQAVVGVLTVESDDVDAIVQAERVALTPFILVAMGVAVASAGLLTWSIARPMRRLAQAADRVRAGRERQLVLTDLTRRDDELGELAEALEAMTGALAARSEANERFAADVAHEIKNPLASIRNAADLLPRATDPAIRAQLEGLIAADVKRLDRLVTDISNASRLDAQLARDTLEPVSMAALIGELVAAYPQPSRERPGPLVAASLPADSPLRVLGREEALGRVLRNLIDNALSFSPPEGEVRVTAAPIGQGRAGMVRIQVDDEGPGLPPENLESVFQRFYTDRPRAHGFGAHSGLGLSIARQIAEAHNGRLWADNRPEGGARFVLELPAAP